MRPSEEFPAARALAEELRERVEGEVRFDDGSRALYSTDGSNYRQVPIGVVIPRDARDVVETIAACRRAGAPVLSRGGGTSLAGQCCNVAVVIDYSKHFNALLDIDVERRTARVQPGIVLDALREAAKKRGLTFGPDPSTHGHCTLGGMIGNNSCGVHSVMAGRTVDNVESLDVLTYDGTRMTVGRTSPQQLERLVAHGGRHGEIYRRLKALRDGYADLIREKYPRIPRRVSGYSLDELLPENGFNVARALVGSEGTCVAMLEATVRLVPYPPARSLLVLGYDDVFSAADDVPEVMRFKPVGLEGLDDGLVSDTKRKNLHPEAIHYLPKGRGWLLAEFAGDTKEESDARAAAAMAALNARRRPPRMKLFDDPAEEEKVWKVRESGLGATAMLAGEPPTWEGWEDSAVPPERLGDYLRRFSALLQRYGYKGDLYGHFGDGCVHTRISFDLQSPVGVRKYRAFVEKAADLVVSMGGSLSGEHGDGQSRGELLVKMFGPRLIEAFREFKTIWDPDWKMNPGKKIDPYKLDSHLKLGADYDPPELETHFRFPEDEGKGFAHAALRCVGVGNCRNLDDGVMCPSYKVTREEMHSTRGRARLLFEMVRGTVVKGGWRDRHVKEALDLCLACKGCKSECPVNVDMATYKAEFLSHYYGWGLRPRSAYAMGLIHWWARAASMAPGLANALAHAPGIGSALKTLGGIAPQRELPRLAPRTFRSWFGGRPPRTAGERVVLFPDTFVEHFHPRVGEAAVAVLEHAGYRVELPRSTLCCGRPLYDYGMLSMAKGLLRRALYVLRDEIREGTPIIVLEPSCAAVFKDELIGLFPNEQDARRLSLQVTTLADFLSDRGGLDLAPLKRRALVQAHCHHKSVIGFDKEAKMIKALDLRAEVLDSGCCGMAGSFGFEKGERYKVSMAAGESVLLPLARAASSDTLIIADGFSCREQIRQGSGRHALHFAEAALLALAGQPLSREAEHALHRA